MAFEQFPYSDLHTLNLDVLIAAVKKLQQQVEELEARVTALEEA